MDTDDVTQIIDNNESTYEEAYQSCVNALAYSPDINVLEDEYTRKNRGHEHYQTCAYVIREIIEGIFQYDSGNSDPATLFVGTLLRDINWYEIGEHYYHTTVARWVHENESE